MPHCKQAFTHEKASQNGKALGAAGIHWDEGRASILKQPMGATVCRVIYMLFRVQKVPRGNLEKLRGS